MSFLGFILTVWLVIMGIYYLCVGMFHLAIRLPFIAAFIICLPVMPFIVVYRDRKNHPFLAWASIVFWAIVYIVIIISAITDAHL